MLPRILVANSRAASQIQRQKIVAEQQKQIAVEKSLRKSHRAFGSAPTQIPSGYGGAAYPPKGQADQGAKGFCVDIVQRNGAGGGRKSG